jgi:hypothetical protein
MSAETTKDNTRDVVLRNADLEVVITPTKGADIYAVIDRATGVDVLFKTPWGRREPVGIPPYGDSQADWLARYAGGWQILLPHAGPAEEYDGVVRGYHGEAALLPWDLSTSSETSVTLTVDLFTVPLQVTREIRLDGPSLQVTDTVVNQSDVPVSYAWVHHPAFGPPFAGPACRIQTGAGTLITDATAPGTVLGSDRVMSTDDVRTSTGEQFDLTSLPGPDTPREIFAALTDFDVNGWFTLTNTELGFGVRMDWDAEVLPHAWFWQECHATAGFPWFRRAYAVGIEPANVLPGTGDANGTYRRGDAALLDPGQAKTADLRMTRFDAAPGRTV